MEEVMTDNPIQRKESVGSMTVDEAIALLQKSKTDLTEKPYKRTVAAWRDPKNPSLLHLSMVESMP